MVPVEKHGTDSYKTVLMDMMMVMVMCKTMALVLLKSADVVFLFYKARKYHIIISIAIDIHI